MTHQPPHELLVSERPVRSVYAQERSYARRRVVTLAIVALVVGGVAYALWGHGPSNPAEIPTIRAEGAYKQKPADPGGIDIPHQDVRVYDELESKNASSSPSSQIEHLLPPPETPKEVEHAAAAPDAVAAAPSPQVAPAPAPVVERVPALPAHAPATDEIGGIGRAVKPVSTTVVPVPVPAPAPVAAVVAEVKASAPTTKIVTPPVPQAAPLSIDQVIANTRAPAPAVTQQPKAAPASGNVSVQLASVADEAKARSMMLSLQEKYASSLGGASLRLVRADLGAKGVYYRIQSQALTESGANHICSALKQMNAGCILVRK